MALGKRSLMNEHMIAVLNKVRSMDPEPVQKSYLYYSQAEKEAVDYMIAIELLMETSFEDDDGNIKKGYILGDFGREVVKDITRIQMKIDLQERIFEDPSQKDKISDLKDIRRELNSAVSEGSVEKADELKKRIAEKEEVLMEDYQKTVEKQIEELDSRGQKKMDTISKWKQQKKNQ
ncbi:hypothetical protein [Methanomethylophilus alvi]|uniref:hypothetical protein n=1 Tax=Methanomethylophilus alvi TaxID=1291540 RepID=UPI0037DD867E